MKRGFIKDYAWLDTGCYVYSAAVVAGVEVQILEDIRCASPR